MVCTLHGSIFFLTRVCWCSDKLCSLTVVSLSWAHVLIPFIDSCWFLMQPCQRDWRSLPFNIGLHPCPSHAEMSPDSLNLLKIWTRNGKISEFLAVWLWEAVCLTVGPQNWSQSGGSEHFTTNACIYKNQGSWWDKILIIVSVPVLCHVMLSKRRRKWSHSLCKGLPHNRQTVLAPVSWTVTQCSLSLWTGKHSYQGSTLNQRRNRSSWMFVFSSRRQTLVLMVRFHGEFEGLVLIW